MDTGRGSRKRLAPQSLRDDDDDDDIISAAGEGDGGTGSTSNASLSRNTGTRPFSSVEHSAKSGCASRQCCSACAERWRLEGGPAQRPEIPNGRATFTLCDVEQHCTPGNAWLIAHGYVYDATPFIDHHPGGRESIIRYAGTDCTEDFDFHSVAARKLWGMHRIGKLRQCQRAGPLQGVMGAYTCSLQ